MTPPLLPGDRCSLLPQPRLPVFLFLLRSTTTRRGRTRTWASRRWRSLRYWTTARVTGGTPSPRQQRWRDTYRLTTSPKSRVSNLNCQYILLLKRDRVMCIKFKLGDCNHWICNNFKFISSSSSSLTFNVTRMQSTRDHTIFIALRQCWTVPSCLNDIWL